MGDVAHIDPPQEVFIVCLKQLSGAKNTLNPESVKRAWKKLNNTKQVDVWGGWGGGEGEGADAWQYGRGGGDQLLASIARRDRLLPPLIKPGKNHKGCVRRQGGGGWEERRLVGFEFNSGMEIVIIVFCVVSYHIMSVWNVCWKKQYTVFSKEWSIIWRAKDANVSQNGYFQSSRLSLASII